MPGLAVQLLALLPRRANAPRPLAGDELWSFLEDHGGLVFPALGLLVVALLFVGVRRGLTTNVAELQERQDHKDSIVRMMRAKLLVSAGDVAQGLKVDPFRAAALCEELVKEGKLVQQRATGGVASYRLKGL